MSDKTTQNVATDPLTDLLSMFDEGGTPRDTKYDGRPLMDFCTPSTRDCDPTERRYVIPVVSETSFVTLSGSVQIQIPRIKELGLPRPELSATANEIKTFIRDDGTMPAVLVYISEEGHPRLSTRKAATAADAADAAAEKREQRNAPSPAMDRMARRAARRW